MTVQTYYATAVAAHNAGATQTDSDSEGDSEGLIYQAYETDPRDNYLYPFLSTFPANRRGTGNDDDDDNDDGNETTILSLRGELIEITKRELEQLPDYIIIGLSNSIVLPDDSDDNFEAQNYSEANTSDDIDSDPPMMVDYSPACLRYMLDFFRQSAAATPSPASPSPVAAMSFVRTPSPLSLPTQPTVLLLREDLEYYCIPKRRNLSPETLNYIKHECGLLLQQTDSIFSGFRDCDDDKEAIAALSETAVSEDARVRAGLARSGIGADAIWGVREMEPGRTMISSLLLVQLNDNAHDGVEQALETADAAIDLDSSTEVADQSVANDSKSSVTISNASGDGGGRPDAKIQETATQLDNDREKGNKDDTHENPNANNKSLPGDNSAPHKEYGDDDVNDQNIRNSNYADAEEEELDEDDDDSESVAFLPLVAATDLMEIRRKPARRCWWTKFTVEDVDGYGDVTLHVRKVWVLELCRI